MLISLRNLFRYRIQATDGTLGKVRDFYFDDLIWRVRYLVTTTRRVLPGGDKVLLTTPVLERPDWHTYRIPVKLTRSQIKKSPRRSSQEPVSRQVTVEYHPDRGFPVFRARLGDRDHVAIPVQSASETATLTALWNLDYDQEPHVHLRSAREIKGYNVHASDGQMGHIHDLIADDRNWFVRYLVVDTSNCLPGSRKVLVSPEWIGRFDWVETEAVVALTRDQIKGSPEFDPYQPVNREYEARLYDYYGRPVYWEGRPERPREHKAAS